MNDEIEVVDEHPFGALVSFEMRRTHVSGLERLLDGIGNGMHVSRIATRTNQKEVSECAGLPQIEDDKLRRLFVTRSVDCRCQIGRETRLTGCCGPGRHGTG